MANPSKFIDGLDKLLKRWMSWCPWMSASSDSENIPPLICESKCATTSSMASSSCVESENLIIEKKANSGEGTSVKDDIERSKVHWSQLIEHDNVGNEVAEVNNVKVFKSLQKHPTLGHFFRTFGDGGIYDAGELVVGDKFAEGAQGKLYHVHVTWKHLGDRFMNLNLLGFKYVLKVFKKGTFLKDLQKQWPDGMFKEYEDNIERQRLGKSQQIKYTCHIECGTLLPNGKFAFLLFREMEDLRMLIDRKMKARSIFHFGPFPMKEAFKIMYVLAKGMERLHNLDIVHRDLKASNVLCTHFNKDTYKECSSFYIADYECSIGVVGTGFFRAPEILQAIRDKVVYKRPNLFTKASDVYSYGMVCYEILTGKLPFDGHPIYDFSLVLNGQQLVVPEQVDKWVRDLLQKCWQFDPSARLTFGEILEVLEANSKVCKAIKRQIEGAEMLTLEDLSNSSSIYEFEI